MKISDILVNPPKSFSSSLEKKVYEILENLKISYEWVITDEILTMEECGLINKRLNMEMVKTLFLCDRQKKNFYLYVTKGSKNFNSKEFSKELNIPRLSFAPETLMRERLETKPGAATIFSVLIDEQNMVQVVLDSDILKEEWYGCSNGTTTGYLKLRTRDIVEKILPESNHKPIII